MAPSKVPKAVADQAARADEFISKQAEGKTEPPAPPLAIVPPPAAPNPSEPPAPAPAAPADTVVVPPAAIPPSTEPPAADTAQLAKDVEALKQEAATWRHRYEVLQGKYNTEVAQGNQKLAELSRQVEEVTKQLAKTPETLTPDEQKAADAFKVFREELGEEAWKGMLSEVMRQVKATIKPAEPAPAPAPAATPPATPEEIFVSILTEQVPDWRQLNVEPGFRTWLETSAPYNLTPLVQLAYQNMRLDEMVKFFTDYKKTKQAPAPAAPAAAPVNKAAEFVSPAAGSPTAVAPGTTAETVITRATIKKFYDDKRAGLYKGREKEEQAQEAAINKALSERKVLS